MVDAVIIVAVMIVVVVVVKVVQVVVVGVGVITCSLDSRSPVPRRLFSSAPLKHAPPPFFIKFEKLN